MTTMGSKDYFSKQANVYAAFRPTYPPALYEFIFSHLNDRKKAWDCATGNGQVATYLADHFEEVYATDISQRQLDHATPKNNVFYSISPAEKTQFAGHQFDLITVGQALHWFERDKFYAEVKRVSKPGSLLAVWGYALIYIEKEIDDLITDFYTNVVGPYWDDARRLVEEKYSTLSFPFEPIESGAFTITASWNLQHLTGYLESWSATQKYVKGTGKNPLPALLKELKELWRPDENKVVRFPLFLKLFRVQT